MPAERAGLEQVRRTATKAVGQRKAGTAACDRKAEQGRVSGETL